MGQLCGILRESVLISVLFEFSTHQAAVTCRLSSEHPMRGIGLESTGSTPMAMTLSWRSGPAPLGPPTGEHRIVVGNCDKRWTDH